MWRATSLSQFIQPMMHACEEEEKELNALIKKMPREQANGNFCMQSLINTRH
jgi:hypothetical protein